ncbi:MAG: bifunctional methylenetetrahydrofolate dehydrogenase/methenyltetrahydrofolate cyclohydrolase FolD [Candidatus Kapabacteria bacterium]|nr:bifunctional methylenetetrahydrofolate dehydrogenase/methenyltetrahydrofolate cyclohydrolase FolD [Candidatus Kapabacteria bacterium]MCS7169976.1 bifunctional methylenetetrahydrofolate dehydrogenase/methenyltetrahydrofolate cyclohydrolase FolD [Candidatus Kapabacteria bacterium]MDW8225660.1 bifunctional methylenetetrahydrofolate dehydrogenase/methenyltetrahydrofolate cyclohydrolase FolD [Bacteroidota bacterium]
MAMLIDGKAVAAELRAQLRQKVQRLWQERAIRPGLALLLVGDNPASQVYVRSKAKACQEVGFLSIVEHLPADTPQQVVFDYVARWNEREDIHGILVQLPLPKQIEEQEVLLRIAPWKDVDGFHPENVGRLVLGLPCFVPCTPAGILELLRRYVGPLSGKHVVVVGRSNIVGKPVANLLMQKTPDANAIVTVCHTGAHDLAQYTRQADVLIAAMGVAGIVGPEHLKEGAVVIDVGINRVVDPASGKERLVGDVRFEEVLPRVAAITPVPGGVGPMTIAMLLWNTYRAATGEVWRR